MPSREFSVELRASLSDALCAWSEFAPAAPAAHPLDFEALADARSRVTLRLPARHGERGTASLPAARSRRELEALLSAFASFVERRAPAPWPRERGRG